MKLKTVLNSHMTETEWIMKRERCWLVGGTRARGLTSKEFILLSLEESWECKEGQFLMSYYPSPATSQGKWSSPERRQGTERPEYTEGCVSREGDGKEESFAFSSCQHLFQKTLNHFSGEEKQ